MFEVCKECLSDESFADVGIRLFCPIAISAEVAVVENKGRTFRDVHGPIRFLSEKDPAPGEIGFQQAGRT